MHDWLPFTWAVRALRASLFGAFDDGWLQPWSIVATVGITALLASAWIGRWRRVDGATLRPPIEV